NTNSSEWTILVTIDVILLGYFVAILADSHSKSENRSIWWKWNFWQIFALFPLLGTAIPGLGWAGALRFLLLIPAIQAIFRLLNVADVSEVSIQQRITHLFIVVFLLILAGAALALMFELQYEEECIADIRCDEGQLVMTLEDAIWWSIETTTTVGYGEFAPKSMGARVVASILLFVGIGLVGTLAATLSQLFFSNQMWRNSQREDFLVRMHFLTELHDRGEITDAQFLIEKKRLVDTHEDDTLLLEQMDKGQHQISIKKSSDINERKKRVDEAKKFFDEVANNGESKEED
ncbi:MAG TPA: potassium channel family protein, partial [Candidatus Thalassarchaeaceae archaeon]|nr:potassium channel family protein [Candidatus Thalassarchaeaceae archaeon]